MNKIESSIREINSLSRNRTFAFSGKIASGKDYTADRLCKILKEPQKVAFGDSLKDELDEVYSQRNLSEEDFSKLFSVTPEEASRTLELVSEFPKNYNWEKKTAHMRKAIQLWATEVRRNQSELYWVEKAGEKILKALREGRSVVIVDTRFPNEAKFLKDAGVPIIRLDVSPELQRERVISRDGYFDHERLNHSSETSLDEWIFDYRFDTGEISVDEILETVAPQAFESFRKIPERKTRGSHRDYCTLSFDF